MQTIQAIETNYKGYKMRSRLEARWAVWLDAVKLVWRYEDQGFDLGENGGWYLPDFWLPELECFMEVKPHAKRNDEAYFKCSYLAELSGREVWMVCDPDMKSIDLKNCWNVKAGYWDTKGDFKLRSAFEMVAPPHTEFRGDDDDLVALIHYKRSVAADFCQRHGIDANGNWLVNAFRAFRSARFEHGESGAT